VKFARSRPNRAHAVCAGLHSRGDRHALVVVRSDGSARGRVVTSRVIEGSLRDIARPLWKELAALGVTLLVRVTPDAQSLARVIDAPEAPEPEILAAAPLLAEANLPAGLGPHRAGWAVLEAPERKKILLTAFTAPRPPERIAPEKDCEERWITPLAALLGARGGLSGPLVHADRRTGVIGVLANGATGPAARVVVEDADGEWEARVREAVGAIAHDAEAAGLPHDGWSDIEVCGVDGVHTGFVSDYGPALGAALCGLSGAVDPPLRDLARITAHPPRERLHPLVAGAQWLSTPGRAGGVIAASCAVLLGVPFVAAWARHSIDTGKAAALAAAREKTRTVDARGAMYAQLENQRWPMSKLLADVSGAAPVGVALKALSLSPEQGVRIEGNATDNAVLAQFQKNLAETRVFADVSPKQSRAVADGVDFEVVAKVVSPHTPAKPADDFAATNLAVRLYGEGASNTAVPVNAVERRTTPRAARSEDAAGPDGARTTRRPEGSTASDPPPPLAADEIKKFERNTAMAEWSKRKNYLSKLDKSLDPAVKQRLEEEIANLRARMDETRGQRGGST